MMLTCFSPPGFSAQLVEIIKHHVDDAPLTIGNPASLELEEVSALYPPRLKFCRCAQMIAGTEPFTPCSPLLTNIVLTVLHYRHDDNYGKSISSAYRGRSHT